MTIKKFTFVFFLFFLPFWVYGIGYSFTEHIQWQAIQQFTTGKGIEINRLSFENAFFNKPDGLPHFSQAYPIHTAQAKLSASLTNIKIEIPDSEEQRLIDETASRDTSFLLTVNLSVARKQAYAIVNLLPIRWNPKKKRYEKLLSFEVKINVQDKESIESTKQIRSSEHSVLASGQWFKIKITKSGLYKITYAQLNSMGFPVNGDPKDFGLFGNGGGILPENSGISRPVGLTEDAIEVVDGGDGSFDAGDYILFYGQGPVTWNYNSSGHFTHQNNYYDDYAYYFLSLLDHPGLRIQKQTVPTANPDVNVNSFTGMVYHELDKENLGGTGRIWYGETFDFTTSQSFDFNFPSILPSSPVYVKASFASKAFSSNRFLVSANGSLQKVVNMPITGNSGYDVGKGGSTEFEFSPNVDKITIKIEFQRSSNSSVGYLDYIDVNAQRQLTFTGSQMIFRKLFTTGQTALYHVKTGQAISIWDITDPLHPQKMSTTPSATGQDFVTAIAPYKSFIAFNQQEYFSPEFVEKVENQDLHSIKNIDYLIITYPDFLQEAERLANYHRSKDQMEVYVTTPQKIYNEFSSGTHDVTAIRDFVKHIYDHSDPGKEIKYLLLFGDASYDYKNRLPDNTNFVPCWESMASLNTISSIASDDYFGYLDTGEGNSPRDKVDIGIGRFPVKTEAEAKNAVDKCIHYATPSAETLGPWRNSLTFVADDGDYNLHLNDAETLTAFVSSNYPGYEINKLYLDAFPQISTPSGQRAPALNAAIDEGINAGTLIFNYSGHGGEVGLGHERFLQISDINSWNNYNKLSVFITATCEFTRYDDPARTSAGELCFLSQTGGAISLFTTTRATYASSNLTLNMAIYKHNLFEKSDGEFPCFGDVIRRSKVLGGDNDKKFILIGDPALKMAYPVYHANTTHINSKLVVADEPDTLKALSHVHIQGDITNDAGQVLQNYTGTLNSTIFDKESAITTLGTDPDSRVTSFDLWNNIIFKGKADIKNGQFDFSFVVPKDIAYQFGKGRISYYFNNGQTDGNGFSENIIVGGYDQNAAADTRGPEIKLYMNDSLFSDDEITHASPILYAIISDQSGINTTGNGIGHDIIATLDDDPNQSFNLNAYYQADEGNFTKGSIRFPLQNLSEGSHTIKLKVWDVYNNSSSATLSFIVKPASSLVVDKVGNVPNPLQNATDFIFDHNQAGKTLSITINIYSLNGQLVRSLHKVIIPDGFSSTRVHWDGTTEGCHQVENGLYIYQLVITNEQGQSKSLRGKLLVLH